jgi:uncharacterized membrane protein YbhN (UPF0104 family)
VAALLVLGSLGVRAWRWRLLLGAVAAPWGTLLSTYLVGVAAGMVVPASGELARVLLLGQRSDLRPSYLLGAAAIEKLLDTAAVVALSLLGLWAAAGIGGGSAAVGRGATLLLAGALGLAVLVAVVPGGASRPPRWLPHWLARGWETLGRASADAWGRFAQGARAVLGLPRGAKVGILALTLLGWANACLATVCALAAFDLPASWALAAVLYGALLLGLSVPSAPAAVGTFEVVTVAVLQAFGLPAAPSAAFALGFHLVTFAPPILAGVVAWTLGGAARWSAGPRQG